MDQNILNNLLNPVSTEDKNSNTSNVPTLTQDELDQIMLDEAGVPDHLRFETWVSYPEVTLIGYMKNSTTFVPDEKVAIKGYWQKDQWDIIDSLGVGVQYKLEPGKRYTLSGVLRFSDLQSVEIIEQHG